MKGFALALLLVCAVSVALAADPPKLVQVEGTCVALVPPAGYTPSEKVAVFVNPGKASLAVYSFFVPYKEATSSKSLNNILSDTGIKLQQSQDTKFGSAPGKLLSGTSDKDNTTFTRWLAIFGDNLHSSVVCGNILADAPQIEKDVLLVAVKSARISLPRADFGDKLHYTVCEMPPFFKVGIISDQTCNLTSDGNKQIDLSQEAELICSEIPRPPGIKNILLVISNELLDGGNILCDVAIIKTDEFMLDDLPAAIVLAKGKVKKIDAPAQIYALCVMDDKTCYLLYGIAPPEKEGTKYMELFKRIASTFKRKK